MIRHAVTFIGVLCVTIIGLAAAADGAMIEIQVSGLDLLYDGTDINDAKSASGGNANTAEADPLISMSFLVDGSEVGTLTTDIFADVHIDDVTNIPATGGFVTSGGQGGTFGFDLISSSGFILSLNLDEIQVFYSGGQVFIAGGGVAESLASQNLPFGIVLDDSQPINIAFSSSALSNVTSAGGFLTGFRSSGTGNIRGIGTIPEPATLALALAAGGCLLTLRRRSMASRLEVA